MSRVQTLQPALQARARSTIDRAFAGDPMFQWLLPDTTARQRALQAVNTVALRCGTRYGLVTESHDARAVAIWLPPGRSLTPVAMIRGGMLAVPFRTGFGPFARFMGAVGTMDKLHARFAPEPHWYLMIVSVDPELQSRGLGTALIEDGLRRADGARCPSYLETSQPRNVAYYERFGFKVMAETALGPGGPPAWAMRRDARS